jgi:hypothetical protein
MYALAQDPDDTPDTDMSSWLAFQTWLGLANHRVYIPYAVSLATALAPVAVRLRRDFALVLNLIKAHALLHQMTREVDQQGRVIATFDDYEVVRELVDDLVSQGVQSSVSATVRETVQAVSDVLASKLPLMGEESFVKQAELVNYLGLDKGTVSRRLKVAVSLEYLKVNKQHKGSANEYSLGDAMPSNRGLLPTRGELEQAVAELRAYQDIYIPPPPVQV